MLGREKHVFLNPTGDSSPVFDTHSPAGRKFPTTIWETRGLKSPPTKKKSVNSEKTKNSKMLFQSTKLVPWI